MEGIIFDFNGTLFLDNDKHVLAWNKISQDLRGRDISQQELHENLNGVPNIMAIRYLNGGKEDRALEEEFSKRKESYYRAFCKADPKSFHLIQGAEKLFEDLQEKGIPFTIASASIKENIDFFVESFHLQDWIDPEKIVYDDGTYENKEAMFEKASEILNIPLSSLTVIEDSIAGINAALACGVQDIRVLDSGNHKDQLQGIPQIRQIVMNMDEIQR